jgi:UDPglucose 6-dehydrogenase
MKDTISIFGLGKVGCSLLCCFAAKGWPTIGVDIDDDTISKLKNGLSPIYEPHIQDLLSENKERISVTKDYEYAILNSNISIIILPTPSLDDGSFTLEILLSALKRISDILKSKDQFHLLIITSTVLPGDMDKISSFLEINTNKIVGQNLGLCYNPDFIALGNVVHNLYFPDIILIGESDSRSGSILENIYNEFVENKPEIFRMNFHNAEVTKIGINSFCTMKITFANMIAEICEKLPEGDADIVTKAIGADSRIGVQYLKPGLGYGGPCFPRDNKALLYLLKKLSSKTDLPFRIEDLNNYYKKNRIPDLIYNTLNKSGLKQISILGITYKSDTDYLEDSAVIDIINRLICNEVDIKIYDPSGYDNLCSEIKDSKRVSLSDSAADCIKDTSLCLLATPWNEFRELRQEDFIKHMINPVIIDAWNFYSFDNKADIIRIRIGKYSDTVNDN